MGNPEKDVSKRPDILTPEELCAELERHEMSRGDLAEAMSSHQPIISAMCTGSRNITKKMTARIYDAIDWYTAPTPPDQRAKDKALIRQIIADLPKTMAAQEDDDGEE